MTRRFFGKFVVKMTRRFFCKFVVEWISKIPPHLAYVATVPCNSSLMACFADLVHKVVYQHMQGAVGFLVSV